MRLSSTSNHGWTGTCKQPGQRLVGGSGPFLLLPGHGSADATWCFIGGHGDGGHGDADTSGASN